MRNPLGFFRPAAPQRNRRSNPPSHPHGDQRGAILPAVIILALVSAALSATLLSRVADISDDTAELVRQKRVFYAVDGMGRQTIARIQALLEANPDLTTDDLMDPDILTPPSMPGYGLELFSVASLGPSYSSPITTGSFSGLNANQKPVSIQLRARETLSGTASQVNLVANLAQITMFQFFAFSSGYLDAFPGPAMTINPGRIHANGDLCIGSDARFELEYATSSSRVLVSDSRCRRSAGAGAYVTDGTTFQRLTASTSHGCTNCAGSGLDWADWTTSVFRNHVKDVAHTTPILRLPLASAESQAGLNAAGKLTSNSSSFRVLLDPVRKSDDSGTQSHRYAWKADLRILNGVWYINDGTWPGKPIWSDHPGSFTVKNDQGLEGTSTLMVGQADLAATLGWTTVPKRFSYYEYDTTLGTLSADMQGILSYGGLITDSLGVAKPGFWSYAKSNLVFTDVDGKNKPFFCSTCLGKYGCDLALGMYDASTSVCQYILNTKFYDLKDAQRLQATMSGFLDSRVKAGDATRGAMLPLNLDVAALALAMKDETPGELGSYFKGGRTFNGVLYISSDWSGSLSGFPDALATLWPAQGAVSDLAQPLTRDIKMVQRALPRELCSDSLGFVSGVRRVGFSLPSSDGSASNGFEPFFTVPSCDPALSPTARINSVRVINAKQLDAGAFPNGLSLATNLPAYAQGNINSLPALARTWLSSEVSELEQPIPDTECGGKGTGWLPMQISSDALSLLSSAWTDANAPWDGTKTLTNRIANNTIFNLILLAGQVETASSSAYSGGLENFPRFLENWGSKTATIKGSLIMGFASVYQRQPWGGANVYSAPTRSWSFDVNLQKLTCQPPGAPAFSVGSFSYLEDGAL